MKLEIEIADRLIDEAFESPHSRYWCSELVWSDLLREGHCIEIDGDVNGKPRAPHHHDWPRMSGLPGHDRSGSAGAC